MCLSAVQASRAQELKRQELLAKQLDAGLITSLDTDGDGVNKLEFVVGADVENRGPSPLRGTSKAACSSCPALSRTRMATEGQPWALAVLDTVGGRACEAGPSGSTSLAASL